MYIDFEQIERDTGRKFENIEQLFFYVNYVIEFLTVNNKNYTKKQHHKINELFSFIKSIKFSEDENNV